MSLLFMVKLVAAQSNPDHQPSAFNSTNGYWKIFTDYKTRTTRVSFYTRQDQLLYQEKIKGRYVKLTRRTVRLFDTLLNRLVNRDLIANQVKSYDLTVSNQPVVLLRKDRRADDEGNTSPATNAPNQPAVTLDVVSNTQLQLSYINPAKTRLLITLADESQLYLYKGQSTLRRYTGLINVGQLTSGTYRFGVNGLQKTVQYELLVDQENKRVKLNVRTPQAKR